MSQEELAQIRASVVSAASKRIYSASTVRFLQFLYNERQGLLTDPFLQLIEEAGEKNIKEILD